MILGVAGAGGFLGGFLARSLAAAGHRVIGLGRGDPFPTGPLDALIDCNGDSRRFWANANPGDSFTANVASVAARASAIPAARYIYMSSMDVYGKGAARPETSLETATINLAGLDTYGFHKWLAERVVEKQAKRPLILRLGTLIGPGIRKNPVFDALNGNPIRQTPDSTLSLVDLDHVGRVLAMLLEMEAEGVYNVSASASLSVACMLDLVSQATGRQAPGFHGELLHTDYGLNIAKLSALMPMPTSEEMLTASLPLMREAGV